MLDGLARMEGQAGMKRGGALADVGRGEQVTESVSGAQAKFKGAKITPQALKGSGARFLID